MDKIKAWLSTLSPRTGMWVLCLCAVCYIISFAQMLLPLSVGVKGVLWVIFFGMAKCCQYSALLIFGKAGIERLRARFRRRRVDDADLQG